METKAASHRSRQWVWGAAVSVFCCVALASGGNSFFGIDIPNINFPTWEDDGTVEVITGTCVHSADKGKSKKYGFSVAASSGSDFYIYYDGITSNTGNKRIPISISRRWRDADNKKSSKRNWSGWTAIQPSGSINTHYAKGSAGNCKYESTNLAVAATIDGSVLANSYGGDYSGSFTVSATNEKNLTDSDVFDVSMTVVSADFVRITGMEAKAFVSDFHSTLVADDSFCVHSTLTDYDITVASDDMVGGNFALRRAGMNDLVPISIQFADNVTGTGLVVVTPAAPTFSGQGDSSSDTCSGGVNAMLRFTLQGDDIAGSLTGNYGTTFTITVTPP